MDKLLHFAAGIAIFFSFHLDGKPKEDGYWRLTSVTTAAIGKEAFDSQQIGNRFDVVDALATVAGGLTAYGVKELVTKDTQSQKKPKKHYREDKILISETAIFDTFSSMDKVSAAPVAESSSGAGLL